MFKITTPTGETFLTEDPNFIRVHSNNCFLLTKREKAEGIAYHGTPYLFKDGTMCYEVDAGIDLAKLKAAAEDSDAMSVEHEYRLVLLELGLTE